ncbi:PIN domain-containing protein [Methylovulum psychrotolerans]|uniref:PIN domain-containing protein n=1 Tax=Methylovulum psychrotolerans TaxID=1704499 RepID=A0A2S5CFJ0_9GAMM|nr:PIN domain-containing protein [Methylovulum psychrotolerans]POZ49570.1 PIN domain-containing protein [Methylovulum psychrotolerans]
MAKFSVIYDACVLYPAPLRDLLMHLALTDLFKAQWTDHIHEEWITALLRREQYDRAVLERTRDLMDTCVRDAKVFGYEDLIEALVLPDPNDRHVLAAAIKSGADAIVTFNLKDFPSDILAKYGIGAIHPDEFIYSQIDLAPATACGAIKRQRQSLKNPPKAKDEFLAILQKQQLPQTVSALRAYIELI